MNTAEKMLIQQVLAGDNKAFEWLIERYKSLVKGKLMSMVRRPDEVDDLMQEVFCRAYEELPSLRQPEQFSSWIWRITSNTALSWWRQHQRQSNAPDIPIGQAIKPPDQVFKKQDEVTRLWVRLQRLPSPYRRVLNLYVEGCSYKEITHHLRLQPGEARMEILNRL
jgi:RNA polymerase sigma-70 factor (ECF subfamily)